MVLNLLNLYSLIIALFDKISFMTSEQQYFKNITCTETTFQSNGSYSTSSPYYGVSYYNDDVKKLNSLDSDNLVSYLAFNISNATYPKILQLMINNSTEAELYLENTTMFDFYTRNENLSSYVTNLFDNETLSNIAFPKDFNFTDFKELFEDYLIYVLYPFTNTGNDTEETTTNVSNISDNPNTTSFEDNSFKALKSTVTLLLNNISNKTAVNTEMSDTYSGINATANSYYESITSVYNTAWNETTTLYYDITSAESNTRLPPSIKISTMSTYVTTKPASEPIKANYTTCARLRSLCWETMFGQELIKLTIMDLIMTILSTLAVDFFRGIFVRIMNRCWCWDLEKKFPQYGDFKVAENILHLVNNQGMVWMGMFFSPGLVVLNVIKLHIIMYFRAWVVLTCNVPPEVIFRASRSNNFYYALLLMMLFLCVLPVGYAIVWIKPSWHCGPFSKYERIFHIFTETIRNTVPEPFQRALDYIASPGIVIPLLLLLVLIIYYLISLTGALREANEDLKIQLRRERTEERRKMFQIADKRRGASGESNELSNTPFAKWKKLLDNYSGGKSFEGTPKQHSDDLPQPHKGEKVETKNKDFFVKLIRKTMGKSSTSDEGQNIEDGTDTEHDSLPDDTMMYKQQLHRPIRPSLSWGNNQFLINRHLNENQRMKAGLPSRKINSLKIKSTQMPNMTPSQPDLNCCNTVELKENEAKPMYSGQVIPSSSKSIKQDLRRPIWPDNIPVITISKIENAVNVGDNNHEIKLEGENLEVNKYEHKVIPKMKCLLKKQSAEYDEDCHFSGDLELNVIENKIVQTAVQTAKEDSSSSHKIPNPVEILTHNSSSEDTEYTETSVDTVLNLPPVKTTQIDTDRESLQNQLIK